MNKKVIFILSDALRHDYIDSIGMDFLSRATKERCTAFVERIIPSTGYCEIIEYVTGLKAEDSGYLAQITSNRDFAEKNFNSLSFKIIQNTEFAINKIPRIRTYYNRFIEPIVSKYFLNGVPEEISRVRYKIPLQYLSKLMPTESKYRYDSLKFGGDKNLFQILSKNDLSYDINDFVQYNKIKGSDEERLERLKIKISSKKLKDFTLLYIGYGEVAHYEGTESDRFKKIMTEYDKKLESIYETLKNNYDNYELVILGDHGMIDVNEYIDIRNMIRKINEKFKLQDTRNIMYFIDSTMLRVFLKDSSKAYEIKQDIIAELSGKIESDDEVTRYLDKFIPEYGDMIFLLKPGKVFYPDYFNSKKIKGMHGYLNSSIGQEGLMLSIGSEPKELTSIKELHLFQVKDEILKLFNIKS